MLEREIEIGDTIRFTEPAGSRRSGIKGEREIIALVIGEKNRVAPYGHSFLLRILSSSGDRPISSGKIIPRWATHIYRRNTVRRVCRDGVLTEIPVRPDEAFNGLDDARLWRDPYEFRSPDEDKE